MVKQKMAGYNNKRLTRYNRVICASAFRPNAYKMSAVMPFSIIKASSAYAHMIIITCTLSNGDESTGIRLVICGLDSPINDTINAMAHSSKPKGKANENRRHNNKVSHRLIHAKHCIVSKPFDSGR